MRLSIAVATVLAALVVNGCSAPAPTSEPSSEGADTTRDAGEDTLPPPTEPGDVDSGSAPASEPDTATTPPPADSGGAEPAADSGTTTKPPADTGTWPADTGTKPPADSSAPDTSTSSDTAATDSSSTDSGASVAPTYVTHQVTFYGWPDNSPPGPAIALPKKHSVAGGTGTYADPVTFATAPGEFAAGTILYVPYIKKYVIMEDTCTACASDWAAGKRHIDIWMNSNASNTSKLLSCQYSWTRSAVDVEIHPPPDRPVNATPLFDPATGVCQTSM